MTESPTPEDGSAVVPLESLPDGSLGFDQLEVLEEADTIEIAAPIVMEKGSNRVTHLDIVINDTHYYLGWNPDAEQWERILVITETEESTVVETVTTFFDDETGEPEVWFDTESNPGVEDIAEFIWEYIKYTYSDISGLRNMMGEATEAFLDEE